MTKVSKKDPVHLHSQQNLFSGFVKVDELKLYVENKETYIRRFVVRRPEASCILLYNKDNHSFVFIRQFRAPLFGKEDSAYILEVPAGVLNAGENPMETIIRECLEETGYQISHPQWLTTIYPSPGILDEKIHLFFAEVTNSDKVTSGGGLESEHEYLEVIEIPVDEAYEMVESGEIIDGKTISCLFFAKNRIR